MKFKLIIFLLILNLHNTYAGNTETKGIANSIFVSISGSSTINQFQLTSNNVTIHQSSIFPTEDHYFIEIPIYGFQSKNQKITSDFRELVKAENHPTISIVIKSSEFKVHEENNKISHVTGTVTLAGQSHQTLIEYTSSPTVHDKVRIKGEAALTLTNFNLEPPEKLFGAIKVHNHIFVNFVVYVESLKRPAH